MCRTGGVQSQASQEYDGAKGLKSGTNYKVGIKNAVQYIFWYLKQRT